MTIGEVNRAMRSYNRKKTDEMKMKALYDYKLADLIGKSIGRLYSNSNRYPPIEEAYPSLFNGEEVEEQKQSQLDKLSAARFRKFAEHNNNKYKKVDKE